MKRALRRAPAPTQVGATSLLQATLEATADAVLIMDADGHAVAMNRGMASLCGLPPAWVGGDLAAYDEEIRVAIRACLNDAVRHNDRVRIGDPAGRPKADTLRLADGRLLERSLWPWRQSGRITGWVWSFHDITTLDRRARDATFLSEATEHLASLDLPVAMERFGRRAIPLLGDAMSVDVVESARVNRLAAVADVDLLPSTDKAVRLAKGGYGVRFHSPSGSCLVAPIPIAREFGGALSFAANSSRRYCRADLRLAEELGRRLGTAIENSRRASQMRDTLQARSAILSIAAHEIRGPATSIHLAVQSLLENEGNASSASRMLGIIDRAHRRLTRFVDDLLDLGRIDAGRMTFDISQVDLCDVVREVLARMEADIQHSGCPVELQLSDNLVGDWDRFRVDQVVSNLVANALKYGERAPVEISVAPEGEDVRLEVRDHGPGMSPELVGRLFRPFERSLPSKTPGYGLGLYIVKLIVERLGGTVSAENAADGGSVFKVLLPRHRHPA